MSPRSPRRRLVAALFTLPLIAGLAACGSDDDNPSSSNDDSPGQGADDSDGGDSGGNTNEPVTLRLGYFPNVTHAPGIIGVENGLFDDAVGDHVTINPSTFNAGGQVIEALFGNSIDISFIGPNPAINGWSQSGGTVLHIISGVTSQGASLIVRPDITSIEDLRGETIATPARGNTQDVAARAYFAEQGLENNLDGTGDITVSNIENPEALIAFQEDRIAGVWAPEPWATRLQVDAGGVELLNENEIWPGGDFVTTHVIVRTGFLEDHPDVVRSFLEGLAEAIEFVNDPDNTAEAQRITNDGIESITGNRLADEIIEGSWDKLRFTLDPIATSLEKSATDAQAAGLLETLHPLQEIYRLDLVNEVIAERGGDPVPGL